MFSNLEDKEHIFEGEKHFYNNVGLYIHHWKACFNPEKEEFTTSPVWVRLYSLPIDFCIPDILEGIGKALGKFIKVS